MRKNMRAGAVLLAAAVAMSAGSYVAPLREAVAQEQLQGTLTEQQLKDMLYGEWKDGNGSFTITEEYLLIKTENGSEEKFEWVYAGMDSEYNVNSTALKRNSVSNMTVPALCYYIYKDDSTISVKVYGVVYTEADGISEVIVERDNVRWQRDMTEFWEYGGTYGFTEDQFRENLTEKWYKKELQGDWNLFTGKCEITDECFKIIRYDGEVLENIPWTYVGLEEIKSEKTMWNMNDGTLDTYEVTIPAALHYETDDSDFYVYLDRRSNDADFADMSCERIYKEVYATTNNGLTFAKKQAQVLGITESTETPKEETGKTESTETPKEETGKTESTETPKEETNKTESTEKEPVKAEKVTYKVKAGDTMGFIATNFYGTNANRTRLYEYNKVAFKKTGGKLVVGMELVIPEELGGQKMIPVPEVKSGEKLYVVKSGDSLWNIATAELGNGSLYTKIFERNKDRLAKATMIYEGQVLVIPAK